MDKIYIIGLGGIGTGIISPLGKFIKYSEKNKYEVFLIDGDKVEEHSLQRQNFVPVDIGKGKANVMAEYMSGITDSKITAIDAYLKPENIDIIQDNSIVFCGVDNYITRRLLEKHATKNLKNTLLIFGGNEYDDGDVNIIHIIDGKAQTPLYSEKHPEIKKKDKFPDEQSCAQASVHHPQLIFANLMAAQLMLNTFYSWVQTKKIKFHEYFFDVKTNAIRGVE